MKPRTVNMVSTIDHLDLVISSDEDWAQGNDYYFICKSHREYFDRLITETETSPSARDRMSLFYLLSSLKKIKDKLGKFLIFNNLRPNPRPSESYYLPKSRF